MLAYPDRAVSRLGELPLGRNTDGIIIAEQGELHYSPLLLPPQTSYIQKWKTAMSLDDQYDFEQAAGSVLREFGYESSGLAGNIRYVRQRTG